MAVESPREIVLPAPRTIWAILGAPLWIGFLVTSWVQTRSFVFPFELIFIAGAAYLLYEAVYGLFGHEVVVLGDDFVESQRRVFGVITRSRRYPAADVQAVEVRPLSWSEWFFRPNLTMGFDEGMVVLQVGDRTRRIGEGLRGDPERSEQLAQQVDGWLNRLHRRAASPG